MKTTLLALTLLSTFSAFAAKYDGKQENLNQAIEAWQNGTICKVEKSNAEAYCRGARVKEGCEYAAQQEQACIFDYADKLAEREE